MKKTFWCLLLLIAGLAHAQAVPSEFHPNTVQQMTAHVELGANIQVSGSFGPGDWIEIKTLSFQDWDNQKLIFITEELRIQNQVFFPTYQTENENRFAVFSIQNLDGFGNNPRFEVVTRAIIQTNQKTGFESDFNLESGIREQLDFLEPSSFIESHSPELQSKAALEFTSDSAIHTLQQVSQWVNQHIAYDFQNYYSDTYSALQTYHNRAGVCDEFANLTAAFLRIKKIPTKYVTGISFDGQRFGNHGWLEAFVPKNGWVGVDSTYGEAGFVDGAHIVLAKGLDHEDIQNLTITTHTHGGQTVPILSQINEPIVTITDVSFWQGIVHATLEKKDQAKLGEPLELATILTNQTDRELLWPVSLILHTDFENPVQNQIVRLKPREQKTVWWQTRAPKTGKAGFVSTYDLFVQTPDQNIQDTISVLPTTWKGTPKQQIRLQDISPFISGNRLTIKITIQNDSDQNQTIFFTFNQNEITQAFEETVGAHSEKKAVFEITPVKTGTVLLEASGAIQESVPIVIPEPVPPTTVPAPAQQSRSTPITTTIERTRFFEQLMQWMQTFVQHIQKILGLS